jgi:hypothetical protein
MKSICIGLFAGAIGCAFFLQFPAAAGTGNGKEKVIYSFCGQQNCTDGEYPEAGLIDVKGTLYGTTQGGGARASGTAFALKAP